MKVKCDLFIITIMVFFLLPGESAVEAMGKKKLLLKTHLKMFLIIYSMELPNGAIK